MSSPIFLRGAEKKTEKKQEEILFFQEEDLGCVVYSTQKISNFPTGTFFIFTGLDEHNNAICKTLSGVEKQVISKPENFKKTPYTKRTPYFEVVLDMYACFGGALPDEKMKETLVREQLLQILGKHEYAMPMRQLLLYEKKSRDIMERYVRQYRAAAIDPDCSEMDLADIVDEMQENLDSTFTPAFALVSEALNQNNLLLAMALHLNLRAFWQQSKPLRSRFVYRGTNMVKRMETIVENALNQDMGNIIEALKNQQQNIRFQKNLQDFKALFPEATGVWQESPPADAKQLDAFYKKIFQIRQESETYSILAEFEKWGNCRLSLLLCTQSFSGADYLHKEFRDALEEYKKWFSKEKIKGKK